MIIIFKFLLNILFLVITYFLLKIFTKKFDTHLKKYLDIFYFKFTNFWRQKYWPILLEKKFSNSVASSWDFEIMCNWAGFDYLKVKIIFFVSLFFSFFFLFFTEIKLLGFLFIALIIFLFIIIISNSAKNQRLFKSQLPDALDSLVQAFLSGYDLRSGLNLILAEVDKPIKNIFEALARSENYRLNIERAGSIIGQQLISKEWDLFLDILFLEKATGGNIAPLLTELAITLRDNNKAEREVQVVTAAGKFSGYLIVGLGPLSLLFFYLFSPSYIMPLFTTSIGQILLTISVLLEIIGFFFIFKIINVEL